MKRLHAPVVTPFLALLAIIATVQGCAVSPFRDGYSPPPRRYASTLDVRLNGRPAILRNARISMLTLSDGTPSWILGADGPGGRGTMEITFLKSAVETARTYILDNRPASESALLVVHAQRGGLLAYSLDNSQMSAVIIESVSDTRVTGRFTLTLRGAAGQPNTELVCEHFDVPLISEQNSWW